MGQLGYLGAAAGFGVFGSAVELAQARTHELASRLSSSEDDDRRSRAHDLCSSTTGLCAYVRGLLAVLAVLAVLGGARGLAVARGPACFARDACVESVARVALCARGLACSAAGA